MRESENLSLLKDRVPACTVLTRTIKKASKEDIGRLKEKLNQLSSYFYTDKGFQAYVAGKDFFEKQKFTDALDRLSEADEVENGNTTVLHYLALAQLWSKREVVAGQTILRGLEINPYDPELLRDDLATKAALEDWDGVLNAAKLLTTNNVEQTPETLQHLGEALIESGSSSDGMRILSQAKSRDQNLPEPYYRLAVQRSHEPNVMLLTKYIDLCKAKVPYFIERDPHACAHVAVAEKLMTGLKVQEPTK